MAPHLLPYKSMEKRFKDTRAVKLERALAKDFIPLGGGRPVRSLVIGKDDFLDLTIFLNTTDSVDDFLTKM